jgi:hypothetical protein
MATKTHPRAAGPLREGPAVTDRDFRLLLDNLEEYAILLLDQQGTIVT